MNGDEKKSPAELLAERADAWKMSRSLLRNSDLPKYDASDVLVLAEWLMDEGPNPDE